MRTKIEANFSCIVFSNRIPEKLKSALLEELDAAGYYLPFGREPLFNKAKLTWELILGRRKFVP